MSSESRRCQRGLNRPNNRTVFPVVSRSAPVLRRRGVRVRSLESVVLLCARHVTIISQGGFLRYTTQALGSQHSTR